MTERAPQQYHPCEKMLGTNISNHRCKGSIVGTCDELLSWSGSIHQGCFVSCSVPVATVYISGRRLLTRLVERMTQNLDVRSNPSSKYIKTYHNSTFPLS